mmetsp:Transcript_12106/g.28946  ORF Transcript_12106/g.28946 Transcript_12106/m.28946 type:complete len:233 (+) Transcript_12106:502-1200(+)
MRASSPPGPAKSSIRRRRAAVAASSAVRMPRTSPSVRSPKTRRALRAAFSAATALALAGSMVPSMGRSSNSSRSLASSSSSGASSPSAFGGRGGGSRGVRMELHWDSCFPRSPFTRSVAASTSRWQSSANTLMAWSNSAKAASWRSLREARKSFCLSRRFSRKARASLPTFTMGMQPPRKSPMSSAAAPVIGAGTPAAPWWKTASRLISPRMISGAEMASRGGVSRWWASST